MGIFGWIGDLFETESISGPSVNIDGNPMIGCVDIHGHSFGVTDDSFSSTDTFISTGDDDMFSSSSSFDDSFTSTSSFDDSSSCSSGSSMFDD